MIFLFAKSISITIALKIARVMGNAYPDAKLNTHGKKTAIEHFNEDATLEVFIFYLTY